MTTPNVKFAYWMCKQHPQHLGHKVLWSITVIAFQQWSGYGINLAIELRVNPWQWEKPQGEPSGSGSKRVRRNFSRPK